jgi:hypothetical protein
MGLSNARVQGSVSNNRSGVEHDPSPRRPRTMKWGHVVNQANFHKVVRVVTRIRAMLVRAIKDTRESIHGLQEGRHAEVVK